MNPRVRRLGLLLFLLLCFLCCAFANSRCLFNEDCGNTTLSCCRNSKNRTTGICKISCLNQRCIIDFDCGTNFKSFCCRNHNCQKNKEDCFENKNVGSRVIIIVTSTLMYSIYKLCVRNYFYYFFRRIKD